MPRDLHELPKLRDGLSFLFVEHARIEREDSAIAIWEAEGRDSVGGRTPVPIAALGVLLLGPGTTITHAAVRALAENGCSIVWCGEEGVRCYAQGTGETRKAYRLLEQARLVCDPTSREEVAWRMYEKRFGYRPQGGDRLDRNVGLNSLRGREGVRMREAYAAASRRYGVAWHGRRYDRQSWANSDPINRALSAANACLNGICHAAIVSGGYSAALGFIHTGKQLSFVYDIADLYKTEITIPVAFQVTAKSEEHVGTRARHACREAFRERRLLKRILPDIDALLGLDGGEAAPQEHLVGDIDEDGALPTALWEALTQPREAPDAGHDS